MLVRLFLLFTLTTTLELVILMQMARMMGLAATLGLILVTGLLGSVLTRREGLRTLAALREQLQRGEMPTDALLDGVLILVAGAFLLTPGLLTDATGFALLVPPVRRIVRNALRARVVAAIASGAARGSVRFVSFGGGQAGAPGPGGFVGGFGAPPGGGGAAAPGGRSGRIVDADAADATVIDVDPER
jgi:UPF0716 protein FxsA